MRTAQQDILGERGRNHGTFVMVYCYSVSVLLLVVNLLLYLNYKSNLITRLYMSEETVYRGFLASCGGPGRYFPWIRWTTVLFLSVPPCSIL